MQQGVANAFWRLHEYQAVLDFAPAVRTHGSVDTAVPESRARARARGLPRGTVERPRHARATHVVVELVVDGTSCRWWSSTTESAWLVVPLTAGCATPSNGQGRWGAPSRS